MISVFKFTEALFCGPVFNPEECLHVHSMCIQEECPILEKISILLLSDEMLYQYQLSPSNLMYHLGPVFPLWFSVWRCVLLDTCEGSLKCHTIIELLLISPFIIFSVYLIRRGALNVSAPMNCYISLDDFTDHYAMSFLVPCLFLSNICIATLGFFWFPFVWNFLFPSSHFQSVCVPVSEVVLL